MEQIFLFMSSDGQRPVNVNDILYFESVKTGIVLYHKETNGETFFEFKGKMKDLEKTFGSYGFIRVHRGFLVKISAIFKIKSNVVILNGGREVPVSRNMKDIVGKAVENKKIIRV